MARKTPPRGSVLGKVIINHQGHTVTIEDKTVPGQIRSDSDEHKDDTVCLCGKTLAEHSPEDLAYMSMHGRCRMATGKLG